MKKRSEVVAETASPERKAGPAGPAGLAVRLRYARRIAGLTLMQVAQRAECSESLVSKIERGSATPSLAMLHRLSNALDTNISTLMSDQALPVGPVLRQGERPVIRTGDIALERLVLPTRGGLLQANIHIVAPGGASDGQIEHIGEEVGYVLEGELELRLGDDSYVIGPGDTFTFQSSTPHGYRNIGDVEARVLWVNSPATF